MRLEVSLVISLDESSRRPWATLPRCGALASEAVQRFRMTERRPRTALDEEQEMSSATTFVDSSTDTSILTFSLRATYLALNQVLGPRL